MPHNASMGEFEPKDVNLNTDESGCPICGGTGLKPLFGDKCLHNKGDHAEGEDESKYQSQVHASNEGELATGREGEEGWIKTKANNEKTIVLIFRDVLIWRATHVDYTFIDSDIGMSELKRRVRMKYPNCEFRYP